MVAAGCFYASMIAIVKALGSSIPSTELGFLRCAIVIIILVPILRMKRISVFGNNLKLLVIRGIFSGIGLVFGFYAVAHLPLSDSAVLYETSTLFTVLAAPLFLKEHRGGRRIGLAVIGLLGSVLVIKPSLNFFNWAGLAGLLSGICIALSTLAVRELRHTEHAATVVLNYSLFGFIITALFASKFIVPEVTALPWILAYTLCGMAAQFLFTIALRRGEASYVKPFQFTEVLFAATLGMLFFQEVPDLLTLVGAVLIIGCSWGVLRSAQKQI
jgi:drug/metabolite transporter (DMT)-like permease